MMWPASHSYAGVLQLFKKVRYCLTNDFDFHAIMPMSIENAQRHDMALQSHVNVPVQLITHCFIMASTFKCIYLRNEHTFVPKERKQSWGFVFITRDKFTGNCLAAYVGIHRCKWTARFYLNTWESKYTTTLFADAYLCGMGHFKSTSPADTKWHCHYCTLIQQDTCHICALHR